MQFRLKSVECEDAVFALTYARGVWRVLRECGRPIASDAFSAEAMRLIAAIDTTVAEHGAVAIAVSDLSFHCLSGAVDECAASTDSTIRAITDTTRVTATRMHDTLLRAKER